MSGSTFPPGTWAGAGFHKRRGRSLARSPHRTAIYGDRILAVLTGNDGGNGTKQVVGQPIRTLRAVVRIVGGKPRRGDGELIFSIPKPQGVRIGEHSITTPQNAEMLPLREAIGKAKPGAKVVEVGIDEVLGQPSLGRGLILDSQEGIGVSHCRLNVSGLLKAFKRGLKDDGMRLWVKTYQAVVGFVNRAVVFVTQAEV